MLLPREIVAGAMWIICLFRRDDGVVFFERARGKHAQCNFFFVSMFS